MPLNGFRRYRLAVTGDVIIRPFGDPCRTMILLEENMVLHRPRRTPEPEEPMRPAYVNQMRYIWNMNSAHL